MKIKLAVYGVGKLHLWLGKELDINLLNLFKGLVNLQKNFFKTID